jgi:SAM-dependent methyltransferase
MEYDPIKDKIGTFIKRSTFMRKLFYMVLGVIFLREWYVKRSIREIYKEVSPKSILDAGSGFGQYTYFLSKIFPNSRIYAVDVKEDYLNDCIYFFNKCRIKNCVFNFADLTNLEYENEFDFILNVDVMEHIEDDTGVFNRFYKALKQGGRLMINTPSDLGGSDTHPENDDSFIGEHVRPGYSKEDICSKLQNAGFRIERFEYTYGKWGNRYWKLAIKYPMLMLNRSHLLFILLPFYFIFTLWLSLLFMWFDVNDKDKTSGTGILVVAVKSSHGS